MTKYYAFLLLLLIIPGSKIKAELGRLDERQPNPPTASNIKKNNYYYISTKRTTTQTGENRSQTRREHTTRENQKRKITTQTVYVDGGGRKTFRVHHAGPD